MCQTSCLYGVISNLKVLILQNEILHYRIPLYNLLQQSFDVTVVHCGAKVDANFSEIILKKRKCGPFFFVKDFYKVMGKVHFDVIIAMGDLRWPQYFFFKLFMPNKPCLLWGVDFGSSTLVDGFKAVMLNLLGLPIIFYSRLIALKWQGKLRNKIYVAQNSVYVLPPDLDSARVNIVNVGSLVTRKRNELLIEAFSSLPTEIQSSANLIFVGSGEADCKLKDCVRKNGVQKSVFFAGHVSSPDELRKIYGTAFVSVSVGQAGLAVSQSIGNGVPFITHEKAITGGEIFGIVDGLTGALLKSPMGSDDMREELCSLLKRYWSERNNRSAYDKNRNFYEEFLSLEAQVSEFVSAIRSYQF